MPPTFGLNFIIDNDKTNRNFMLLCGFEKFNNIYVRIDILERLFIKIFKSNEENKSETKLVPEMLNLLGCNKENFLKLINNMQYKYFEKDKEVYFKYSPKKIKKKAQISNIKKDSPFKVLNELNLK